MDATINAIGRRSIEDLDLIVFLRNARRAVPAHAWALGRGWEVDRLFDRITGTRAAAAVLLIMVISRSGVGVGHPRVAVGLGERRSRLAFTNPPWRLDLPPRHPRSKGVVSPGGF